MKWKTILLIVLAIIVVDNLNAQSKKKKITVSGYVTDANKNPIERASIIIDDVQSKEFTNKKGFYKIKIDPDTKTITAFSIKHGGIELDFTGHTKINFELLPDSTNENYISPEEAVQYDYGYGKIDKKQSSYSIGQVEDEQIENNSYTDIYQMIKARIPGVYVNGRMIIIRGLSSMNAQGNPLFVVDGSEVSSIDSLNPRDVKSISVLKGSAAAIYGSRGTMGVIVITMKTGANSKE